MPGEGPGAAICQRHRAGGRSAPVRGRRPDSCPADTGLGTCLEVGQTPEGPRGSLRGHRGGGRGRGAVCLLAQRLLAGQAGYGDRGRAALETASDGRTGRAAAHSGASRGTKALRQRPSCRGCQRLAHCAAGPGESARDNPERIPPRCLERIGPGAPNASRERAACRSRPAGVSGPAPVIRHPARRGPVPRYPVHGHGSCRQPTSRANRGPEGAGGLWRRGGTGGPARIRSLPE